MVYRGIFGSMLYGLIGVLFIAVAFSFVISLILSFSSLTEASFSWFILIVSFLALFIGGIKEVGLIDEIAKSIIYYTEGDLPKTAIYILWGSGILSGFVDNIPFVAAMIPVILEFQSYGMTNLDPLWWSLALGACLGGNATLIGSTANVIVAGLAVKAKQSFSYLEFLKVGAPVALVSFIISTIYIYFRYLIYF